jgi:hypothetical protein
MFVAAGMEEENQEKGPQTNDDYAILYKNIKQQKKFAEYGEKFSQFLVDITEAYLKLAREYLPDDYVIMAVGRREQVNIGEFRSTVPLNYLIKVEEQDETLETRFGKQLTFNHILQYVGNQLPPEALGKIIKNMPFGNSEEIFSDLTLDYENVKNDMLMLERGIMPQFNPNDNHEYVSKKLDSRMRQADFYFLDPKIQQMYAEKKMQHEQVFAQQQEQIQALKNEYIPIGGAMIATDMYVPDPEDPNKPAKRVRIPYQALDWLVKQLEVQGAGLGKLENMNQGMMSEIAGMILSKAGPQASLPPSSSGSAFNNAPTSALGVSG